MYGTCGSCAQVRNVDKFGKIRAHNRDIADGNIKFTVRCIGSNHKCAETLGSVWHPSTTGAILGKFVPMREEKDPEEEY
jgi:hypothetical protein